MEKCPNCGSSNVSASADLVRVTYECRDCGNEVTNL
jgi:predicted RNA-binding Zn-ribbon protein involved in translation (DUF1610 family)